VALHLALFIWSNNLKTTVSWLVPQCTC